MSLIVFVISRAQTNIIVKNLEDAAALDYFLEDSQVLGHHHGADGLHVGACGDSGR